MEITIAGMELISMGMGWKLSGDGNEMYEDG